MQMRGGIALGLILTVALGAATEAYAINGRDALPIQNTGTDSRVVNRVAEPAISRLLADPAANDADPATPDDEDADFDPATLDRTADPEDDLATALARLAAATTTAEATEAREL